MIKPFDTARLVLGAVTLIEVHYQETVTDNHSIRLYLAGSGREIFHGSLTELIELLDEKDGDGNPV